MALKPTGKKIHLKRPVNVFRSLIPFEFGAKKDFGFFDAKINTKKCFHS